VLTAGGALVSGLGEAIERDPEVRQARLIAEAARTRLLACVSGPEDDIDLAEAQGMLDALRYAWALAGDAQDRVLLDRGLLTPADADRRAAGRRPAQARVAEPARTGTGRPEGLRAAVRVVAGALALAVPGVAVAVLARRGGVRLPRARR
jgi:hypothetical protein